MTDSFENQYQLSDLEDLEDLDTLISKYLLDSWSSSDQTQRKRKTDCSSTDLEALSSSEIVSIIDPEEGTSSQRKERYQRKKAVVKKIERMLSVPTLICAAGNAGDVGTVADIVNSYFTCDCEFIAPSLKTFRGKEEMLRYLLAMDESCPDYMRVFTNVRFADMEIRFDFSCSGTLVSDIEQHYDPLLSFSAHLADKADRIASSGKKYKFVFQGSANMLLTPDLDFIQRFSTKCHSTNIIESRVDL